MEQEEKIMQTLEKGKADSGKWVEWEQLGWLPQSCLQSSSELMFVTLWMNWPSDVEQASSARMQGRMVVEFPLDSKHDAVAKRKLSVAVSELVIASPMARQQLASLKTSTCKQRLLSGCKPKVRAAEGALNFSSKLLLLHKFPRLINI